MTKLVFISALLLIGCGGIPITPDSDSSADADSASAEGSINREITIVPDSSPITETSVEVVTLDASTDVSSEETSVAHDAGHDAGTDTASEAASDALAPVDSRADTGPDMSDAGSDVAPDGSSEAGLVCPMGLTNCGGMCVNTRETGRGLFPNCGACGNVCNWGTTGGRCEGDGRVFGCNIGTGGTGEPNYICFGVTRINLYTDPMNCGVCGNRCVSGTCREGVCL